MEYELSYFGEHSPSMHFETPGFLTSPDFTIMTFSTLVITVLIE